MSPTVNLRWFIKTMGIPVSDRSCHNSYLWDGETLALNWQRENWNEDCSKLLSLQEPESIDDFTLAHEAAHWIVASPVEREFPEYGCMLGIDPRANGGLPWDTVTWGSPQWKLLESRQWGVLTREEQDFREACADFLAVYWCDLFRIEVEPEARPVNKYTRTPKLIETAWNAIIWLRDNHLLPVSNTSKGIQYRKS